MDDEEKKARKERMKDYRRRYREKHGIVEKRRPWKKAIGAVAALCVLAFAGFFAAQSAAADRLTNGPARAMLGHSDKRKGVKGC